MSTGYESTYPATGYGSETQIRNEFSKIQTALEDTVSRSNTGTGPNELEVNLDMGGNTIFNVQDIMLGGESIYDIITDISKGFADAAEQSAIEASQEAGRAEQEADRSKREADRVEQEFRTFVASSGYQFAGDYATGIGITQYNQILRDENGEFWRLSGSTELPYTTTGAGLPEGGSFVAVGDAALRQDLANPYMGAAIVARGVVAVDSIADLLALPEGQRKAGLRYLVKGFHAGTAKGGGGFYWDSSSAEEQNGVTVFGDYAQGRFYRIIEGSISPEMAGASPSDSGHLDPIRRACAAASEHNVPVVCSLDEYTIESGTSVVVEARTSIDFNGATLIIRKSGTWLRVLPSVGREEKEVPASEISDIMSWYQDDQMADWDNDYVTTNSLVVVETDVTVHSGYALIESFVVGTDGVITGNPSYGLQGNVVSATYKPLESSRLYIENAKIVNAQDSALHVGRVDITRHSTTVRNITLERQDKSATTAYTGTIFFAVNVFSFELENVYNDLDGSGYGGEGVFGYIFQGMYDIATTLLRVNSAARWGSTGNRGSKEVVVRDCHLSRWDSHTGLNNLLVDNCTFYGWGILVASGRGSIVARGCTITHLRAPSVNTGEYTVWAPGPVRAFIRAYSTGGGLFTGNILVEDLKIRLQAEESRYSIVDTGNGTVSEFYSEKKLPEVEIRGVSPDLGKRASSIVGVYVSLVNNTESRPIKLPKLIKVSGIRRDNKGDSINALFVAGAVGFSNQTLIDALTSDGCEIVASNLYASPDEDPKNGGFVSDNASGTYEPYRNFGIIGGGQPGNISLFSANEWGKGLKIRANCCYLSFFQQNFVGEIRAADSLFFGAARVLSGGDGLFANNCEFIPAYRSDLNRHVAVYGTGIVRNSHFHLIDLDGQGDVSGRIVLPTGIGLVNNTVHPAADADARNALWYSPNGQFADVTIP